MDMFKYILFYYALFFFCSLQYIEAVYTSENKPVLKFLVNAFIFSSTLAHRTGTIKMTLKAFQKQEFEKYVNK